MSAIQTLFRLFGLNTNHLSKEENIILEADLFLRIYQELIERFRRYYRNYFRTMNYTTEMEDSMLEKNFLRLIMNDILISGEYTVEGLAIYTDHHEDVVHEVLVGRNTSPSAILLRRTIELHQSVRRELYQDIIKKIASDYLEAA